MSQKRIRPLKLGILLLGGIWCGVAWPEQLAAQGPNPPGAGFDAALMQLFGQHKNFVAEAELRVVDGQQTDKVILPMRFAARAGRFRTEVDLTQMRGAQAQREQMEMVKQMGMDQIVNITHPDAGTMHLVFPSARATVRLEMPADDRKALAQPPKLERSFLGEETVDGHPCRKEQVAVTLANGRRAEVTVWSATDLQGFPLQIQTSDKGDTVTFRYRKVRFAEPGADLFEPPRDYTIYTNMESFTAALMQKLMKEAVKR
ncbi:MAG: hypothetical protein RMN51_12780 [Verrucomicrobiota bacterium]|nr:hypothetical protein [Limisphaera sp.]MDW8382969.1 hypothetical protein [Verrucomicrobiota bacterium]